MSGRAVSAYAPDGVPEVGPGDDLVALLLAALLPSESAAPTGREVTDGLADGLTDGDVVVVTSKVVSKAEGRVRPGTTRETELAAETVRVVARRGATSIVRTRHGLTMAAAGIDASNVAQGSVVLLPVDPDASARRLREAVRERTGRNVGVVVTDTAGRAWREGQTDIAIGAAGLLVAEEYAGRLDAHGNPLAVTAPAVADEIAGAAELAQGKLGGRPFAVVRGRADLVLPPGEHGPGAVALVRPEGGDLFGYGAREAVVRALRGEAGDRAPFGSPAAPAELSAAVLLVTGLVVEPDPDEPTGLRLPVLHDPPHGHPLLGPLAYAHGWRMEVGSPAGAGGGGRGDHTSSVEVKLRPAGP